MGNIGRHHADYLIAGKVPRITLTGVCSTSPGKLDAYKEKGLTVFSDGFQMIGSGAFDAVLVATPHYQHTTLGIAALDSGVHLMCEKPISAHKADAERLITAHRRNSATVFAGMFQLRVESRYLRLQRLIQSGELGTIVRMNWIITDWFRTEAYYASGGWRATWKEEGGGVLLNQCLHNLDVVAWLLGMPTRIRGFCQLGRYHSIEVEDNVTATLEWANGATGVFVTSTGETPGTNRLEIAGTRGRAVLENNRLTFVRNEADMFEWSRTATVGFSKPDTWTCELPIEIHPAPHAALMNNFADAILDGTPLIAPGSEGIHSVELANTMLYSSLSGQTINLPLDAAAYEARLHELIAASKHVKEVRAVSSEDFARSFNR